MTETKPLVSVIMGIYNCAETLEKAVRCIQNQTYENWELIMCDDCSTDNTYDVACEIARKDSRIIVLRNSLNLTLAPTLNRCIKEVKGKYIARMDGDDTCSPDRFEKELVFLESHPEFALVSCSMSLSNENGVYRTIKHMETPSIKDLIFRSQHCHAACMLRTEALMAVGGYSESNKHRRVEDYELWVRMYKAGYKGYNLQETLYDMYDAESAMKRRSFSNRVNESRVIFKACRAAKSIKYYRVALPLIKWLVPSSVYKNTHMKQKD